MVKGAVGVLGRENVLDHAIGVSKVVVAALVSEVQQQVARAVADHDGGVAELGGSVHGKFCVLSVDVYIIDDQAVEVKGFLTTLRPISRLVQRQASHLPPSSGRMTGDSPAALSAFTMRAA